MRVTSYDSKRRVGSVVHQARPSERYFTETACGRRFAMVRAADGPVTCDRCLALEDS